MAAGPRTWLAGRPARAAVAERCRDGGQLPQDHAREDAVPQPEGKELEDIRARRDQLRQQYLRPESERPRSTVRGVHHLALICRDTEETIRFYQEFLGFPLVELVENRDYSGSNHFFFDIGNHNLLGFFDFPGHDHPAFSETIGAVQHLAISISAEQFEAAKKKLDQAGVDYLGPDRGVMDSMYFRDPNGIGLELYQEELGIFNGEQILFY
jgi:glyoxylase I family protein